MENLRGIILMVASMAGFAMEDMFVKSVAAVLPTGQIIVMLGFVGAAVFGLWAHLRGDRLFAPEMFTAPMMLRNLGEVVGTVCFVSAIILTPLSSASAIAQALPLAVTLGAALFLGAPVGWRRWTAILVGFAGVVMVVRPGMSGFEPASLLAVVAVFGLAARDLCTRIAPGNISSATLSAWGFAMGGVGGLLLMPFGGAPVLPDPDAAMMMGGALACGLGGYYAIVAAMRVGDVAIVTPFRYSRLIFALIIGTTVFGERPDFWTLAGASVIIGSGLYTIVREQRLRRRARAARPAVTTYTL